VAAVTVNVYFNPIQNLLAPSGVLARLPARNVAVLTGRQFFPSVISAPFHHGLVIVFTAAAIMSLTGALVSLLRGRQFYYDDVGPVAENQVSPDGPAVSLPAAPRSKSNSPNGRTSSSAPGDSPSTAGSSPVPGRRGDVHAPRGGSA